jgi:predicted Zn-dependent peptidase
MMKYKITTVIVLFLLSLGVTAQIDRSQQPKAGPAPKIKMGQPEYFELKNGLKVLVVENHKLPRVNFSLMLDNGPIFEGEKVGVSTILEGMMGNGTNSISKDAFNEEIDFLGASVFIGSQSAQFNTLSKYFPRILELTSAGIQNPLLTQEEFEKQQAQFIEGIKSGENSVDQVAGIVQDALTYGKNHPYGEFPTETIVQKITLADVKSFYNTYFKPNNGYLVIIGDVEFKKVKKLIKKHFEKWPMGELPDYVIPEVKNVEKTEINFVDLPNAVQSNIAVISTVNLKMGHPDYFPTRIANYIFGGGAEGRLFLNLREDKGYTYGAYSSLGTNERTVAKLNMTASVRNMVTDSAVVEFIKEIDKFRTAKVTDEELKNAKAAYVGNFVMALENPATVANYALNIKLKNLPEDFYETYLQKINAVTVADVQRMAQTYFNAKNSRIVIVGKALDVLPNLDKLPYKISYYDKEATATAKPELSRPIPDGVTIQTVVDNYLNAIGSKEKRDAVESTFILSEASIQGTEILMSSKSMAPNKFAVVVSGMGMVLSKTVFDGEKGYVEQQGMKTPMDEKTLSKSKENLNPFPEVGFPDNESIVLLKIEPINGTDCYVVTMGDDTTIYYEVASGLKVKQVTQVEVQGQQFEQVFEFSDYQEVEGLKFPFFMKMAAGPQIIDFKVKEVRLNKDVSESDFQ